MHPDAIILDVRTNKEISKGEIPNSLQMDFYQGEFSNKLKKLDINKPMIIYCRSGGRAGKTCLLLHESGATQVYNYGGFDRYLKEQTDE